MSAERDERQLLLAASTGSRKAFAILYSRYLAGLSRYIFLFTGSAELAEEVVQDVFVSIWEHHSKLQEVAFFRAYLYQVARNLVIDTLRQQKRHAVLIGRLKSEALQTQGSADSALIYGQYNEIAQAAIDLLPEKRKRIFLLRTQEELSLDEISLQLAISKPVVKKQLYAATAFVRKYLLIHGGLSSGITTLLLLLDSLQ